MRKSLSILAGLLLLSASPAIADTLSNDDVVQLSTVGLGDEAIIAKIKASANTFELSMAKMIELKSKGVSGPVIAAMLDVSNGSNISNNAQSSPDSADPLVPHPSGIYLLADWLPQAKMLVIDPTTSNQTKTGGFLGYALTGGIASMSFNTVIPNANARTLSMVKKPAFYFYFDQAGRSLSGGVNTFWQSGGVTSPNEFSLVKFNVKKSSREAKVGKFNIGGAKSGVMDKDRIPFEYENVAPGVFKVFPSNDLPIGEFGFIYSSTTGGGGGIGGMGMGATTSKVFDFSIKN